MNLQPILDALRKAIPSLSALYLFGSQASGDAGPESDLDLAILADSPPDAVALWELSGQLATMAGCSVDLVNLRAASTVMQYRILTTGKRVWVRDSDVSLYESFILSDKTSLDEARADLLKDIRRTGTIYG
ncbi:type VII toxin-antitoxin system MntA family adenylyltransferase antitoxin [Halopseudomonas bauzanensis]|uniref:Predicted nucleotidyltransferase n=1 Tax=Halopseudomonas bauzanensis TaxID=653930 RepID=A0A1I4K1W4_9GAMM|nr:nucleotidyltransferase domain-containing protein [Halopseudomonas bauzanensis]SER48682.1 Predicted nucleotidyltransferase [Halopseudomonas bauzanensis]SFL72770.1 Predicted nucleotidyltransferase [Halopseudomonas bauzanensis]